MAPRFRQLTFQTYNDDDGASAFIGFPMNPSDLMFTFRDELRDKLQEFTGFPYRTNIHGPWDVIDVYVRFFDGKDEEVVNVFYSKPEPGCLSWLFGTSQYRNYVAGEAKIRLLIKIKITTSHDYPCIIIESSTLSGDAIAHLIQEVAIDLDVKINKGNFPYSMDAILMSNREFDVEESK
jgi:hypothetical protein